jgi:hypothetical protein
MKAKVQSSEVVSTKDDLREYVHHAEVVLKEDHECILHTIPITNYFSKDVYAREMKLKKGTYLVGKIHKFQNLNILSEGEVSVISIDGVFRVKAPYTFVASAGAKRLFYAHEDCTWTVIHGTTETNVDEIEKIFITDDYNDIEEVQKKVVKCLGQQ